jgi:hypothetical protein
LDLVTCNT